MDIPKPREDQDARIDVASTYQGPSLRRAASGLLQSTTSPKVPRVDSSKETQGEALALDVASPARETVGEELPLGVASLTKIMAGTDRRGHTRRRAREKAAEKADGTEDEKAESLILYERLQLAEWAESLSDEKWILSVARTELDPMLRDLHKRGAEFPQNVRAL